MGKVVIIPAYNPDQQLERLVLENWEQDNLVLVVDDGSDASCSQVFWKVEEKSIVLHHKKNLGKGAAIKTALAYIKEELWHCSVIGIMDADGQHKTTDLMRLMEEAASHPDALVIGVRAVDEHMPWKSRMGNKITRSVFHALSGVYVSDTQTGLRAFTTQLLRTMLETSGERYEYETNALMNCAKEQIEIREVPIQTIYHDEKNSCSHFRKVRDSVRIYQNLLKFGLASFSSFLLDYVLFITFTLLLPKAAWAVAISNVGARVFSGFYNYRMNCRFVFHKKGSAQTGLQYLALAVGILVLNSLILSGIVLLLGIPAYPAKLLTEGILFLVSWVVQNKLIFRKPSRTKDRKRILQSKETSSVKSAWDAIQKPALLGKGRESV